jgi:hypothetical protein
MLSMTILLNQYKTCLLNELSCTYIESSFKLMDNLLYKELFNIYIDNLLCEELSSTYIDNSHDKITFFTPVLGVNHSHLDYHDLEEVQSINDHGCTISMTILYLIYCKIGLPVL